MNVLGIARTFNRFGFTRIADKLVTIKYGRQIGHTSRNGNRTFSGNVTPIRRGYVHRTISKIDHVQPELVITAIDKDYNIIGQVTKRKMEFYNGSCLVERERLLLPKKGDSANTCHFDVIYHYGDKIKPDSEVVVQKYVSRTALVPEVKYGQSKPTDSTYNAGETIYDSLSYKYLFNIDKDGKVLNTPIKIWDLNGGKTFAEKMQKFLNKLFNNNYKYFNS